MALVVEDGTGLTNADSYQSLVDADTYAANYGLSNWNAKAASPGADDADKEVALRNATLLIDTCRKYLSQKLNSDQSLEFPRLDPLIGMPQRVRDAAVVLADLYLTGVDLYQPSEIIKEIAVGVGRNAVMESKKYDSPFVVDATIRGFKLIEDYSTGNPNSGLRNICLLRN